MTCNEIIQAWEHIRDVIELDEEPSISIELITNTLDLIARKKEEIEALIAGQETLQTNLPKVVAKRFERKIKDVQFTIGQTWEIQTALKETLKEMGVEV